jgi:hypothetical protein
MVVFFMVVVTGVVVTVVAILFDVIVFDCDEEQVVDFAHPGKGSSTNRTTLMKTNESGLLNQVNFSMTIAMVCWTECAVVGFDKLRVQDG